MTARLPRPLRSAVFVCAWAAIVAHSSTVFGATATLTGRAGLGGVSKPGRWTPIEVSVEATGADAAGTLVVQWGDASVERPIAVPAGARKSFEFYLHTMEVAATASARLLHGGQAIASVDLPLRAVPADEPFVLCVTEGTSTSSSAAGCTGWTGDGGLPRSVRGYDAVDSVEWRYGSEAAISRDQRLALTRWRAGRALVGAGCLAATDRPPSIMAALARKNRAGGQVRAVIALYVVLLVAVALAARRRHPRAAFAWVLALIACGAIGAVAAGRVGPGSSVLIHHATLIQQLPGSSGSLVTMRGAAEFPALDGYALQATLADAALETGPRQALEANGFPLLHGRYGTGARQPFTLEAATDVRLLDVSRRGDVVRVENRSSTALRECRFADGSSIATLDVLRAGGAVETRQVGPVVGPIVTCTMPALPVEFTEASHTVTAEGRSLVVAYLEPGGEGSR